MKFEYKTEMSPESSAHWETRVSPCCDDAKELNSRDEGGRRKLFLDYSDATVNIGLVPDDCFGGWFSQIEIFYCPFCGTKVAIEEVERINVTITEVTRPSTRTDKVYTEEVVVKKAS